MMARLGLCGKFIIGPIARCGPNIQPFQLTGLRYLKALIGRFGWAHRWTVLIIRTIPTRYSGVGMNLEAAHWQTWGITASGQSSLSSIWIRRSRWNRGPVTPRPWMAMSL